MVRAAQKTLNEPNQARQVATIVCNVVCFEWKLSLPVKAAAIVVCVGKQQQHFRVARAASGVHWNFNFKR
uniref:Uncharacterized protein n=1 Tax=Anopheles albimanus TaxID=7167 RepID=A0A182FM47_ANOAL